MDADRRRHPRAEGLAGPHPLRDASGRRALALHTVIVLALLATAQTYDGSIHAAGHWIVLPLYAACSLCLGLAGGQGADAAAGRNGRGETPGLALAATLLNGGIALYLVAEHMLAGTAGTEEAAAAVSRLPAFLLLLQTGLGMRVRYTALFAGLVALGWGGTILCAAAWPGRVALGPHVTLSGEAAGLLTFLAASLVVVDGVRRWQAAVAAALRLDRERAVLTRFVPDAVAAELSREGGIGAVAARHACLFALDIRGFSALTRERAPGEVVAALLDVRALTAAAIAEQGGIVDKYVGDGVLAQFLVGAPDRQAAAALACACTVHRRLGPLNRRRREAALPILRVTIALHAGDVLVGVFDDGHRAEFTVLGPAMNALARIETRAKANDLPLAASRRFVDLLPAPEAGRLRLAPVPPGPGGGPPLPLVAIDLAEAAPAPAPAA